MGLSPIGSNRKPRSTLVFRSTIDQLMYKNGSADIAASLNLAPSDAVLFLVTEKLAATDEGRAIARTMYGDDNPSCMRAYQALYEYLSALGYPETHDAKSITDSFLRYALNMGISIDTTDERIVHLRNQWDSVCTAIEQEGKSGEIKLKLAAKNARELGTILDTQVPMQTIAPFISQILESWDVLKPFSCTYRALLDFAYMGFPTRPSHVETAETRLALLRLADEYYSDGEEASC